MSSNRQELPWPRDWTKRRWSTAFIAGGAAFVLFGIAGITALAGIIGDGRNLLYAAGLALAGVVVLVLAVRTAKVRRSEPVVESATVDIDGVGVPGVRFPGKPLSKIGTALAEKVGGERAELGVELTKEHVTISGGDGRAVLRWSEIATVEASSRSVYSSSDSSDSNSSGHNWIRIVGHEAENPSDSLEPGAMKTIAAGLRWAATDPGDPDADKVRAEIVHAKLATDPVLVYHALRFYLRDARAREELADARAVERLRSGDVAPPPTV